MPLSGSSAVLILVAVVAAVSLSAIALSSAPSSESSMLSFLSLFPSSSTWPSPLQSSPPPLLIAFRAVGLSLVAATSLSSVRDPEGVTITARYLPASRLPKRSVVLRGFMRLTTFTVWCWLLVGLYFLAALLPPLAIVARTLFGVAFACSVLVTVVVTFILMPFHRAHRSAGNEHLTQWRSVVYHNLNSVLMGIEFAVGARTPELAGLPVAFLWGCAYVLFARAWFSRIGMYYYFFLDDSLPVWQVVGLHMFLLMALALCFSAAAFCAGIMEDWNCTHRAAAVACFLILILDRRSLVGLVLGRGACDTAVVSKR